jgi:small conductance mechanosensitive channel
MKVLVLIGVLGVLGIETTSFAALIAAVGVAIGAAWAGLLSNLRRASS